MQKPETMTYRLHDKYGTAYHPFKLKPGAELRKITDHAFPGQEQDPDNGWDLEILDPDRN